ncbi:MAG: TRAP transporter, 4TM/12TM fusion protein [Synergistales bacterium 54_9]|nr:MAG: TRAP transporter, 4TM/12TM fusion protein [Synergistales bacterium 54_9]
MRTLSGKIQALMYVYIIFMGVFHLYTAVFGAYEAYLQRMIHLTWVLPLAFIFYPATKNSPMDQPTGLDWLLAAVSVIPGIYGIVYYGEIVVRITQVDPLTPAQLWLGILLTFILLEATRRVVGLPLTLIAAFFAGYMYFGAYLPGILKGLQFTLPEVVEEIYLTGEGIFSIPLGVSATFVMIFLIFGGFLEKSGIGEYFMEFAQAFAGTTPGGPAKIAVVSSCLFGSISGSAVANVYGTGTFTIPLMKRLGYQSYFAGAVEAVASSGGQIMPPIMGAGAFIMASLLGIQFREVIIAAAFPAILYYGAVFLMVHLRAIKLGIRGLKPEELPSKIYVLKHSYKLIPIVGLLWMLLTGYTPMLAAVIGIGMAWVVSLFDPRHRMGPREILDAIYSGASNITVVAIACAAAGIIVGSVSLTGIGFKLVGLIFSLARDIPFLALILIMIVSLILGMGLPTTAAYILAAALGVPALTKLGFNPLGAHLFVFYFAIISAITPPVALAAYAASSVAGAHPNRTGFQAMRLGILAFIVPYAFCYDPGLILNAGLWGNLAAIAGGITAALSLGFAMEGFMAGPLKPYQRLAFMAAGLFAFTPVLYIKLPAIAATVLLILLLSKKRGVPPVGENI